MGYALSWLAIKNKDSATIRREFQFEETSQKEEFPESDLTAIQLGEWYIIVGNGDWVVPLSELDFTALSRHCHLVFLNVEEHVMFSFFQYWVNGKKTCQVIHEASSGLDHLLEEGDFPPQYKSIKDKLVTAHKEEQESGRNEVDYIFDIPVELAQSIVGYRHDTIVKAECPLFTVLHHNPKLSRANFGSINWWKQLFSK
jgi:hypothetical protein